MSTAQNTRTAAANRAAATRAANKAHAATIAAIESALTVAEQAVASLIAANDALIAAGIEDTAEMCNAIHAGWDAISELQGHHNAAERAHRTRGIDSNTLALVAANID